MTTTSSPAQYRAGYRNRLCGPRASLLVEPAWGTVILVQVPHVTTPDGPRPAPGVDTAFEAAIAEIAWIQDVFSPCSDASAVAAIRAGRPWRHGFPVEVAQVVANCLAARETTGGAFDPWCVPSGFDPSGYVKGWAAGRLADLMAAAGVADCLVNAGGDVVTRGSARRAGAGSPDGWSVGIRHPHDPRATIATVALRAGSGAQAVMTSGRYERGDHIVTPPVLRGVHRADAGLSMALAALAARAGQPESASVVGPDPGLADAYATALVAEGLAAVRWFRDLGPQWSFLLTIGDQQVSYGTAFAPVEGIAPVEGWGA